MGVPTVVLCIKNLTAAARVAAEARFDPGPGTLG